MARSDGGAAPGQGRIGHEVIMRIEALLAVGRDDAQQRVVHRARQLRSGHDRLEREVQHMRYVHAALGLGHALLARAGVLNDWPLVELRRDLAEIGLEQDASSGDTEDHIAFVFEVMRYLIAGDDLEVCNLERQRRMFRAHVQTWVGALCDALEPHPRARLYAHVARMTRAFVEVETQAFDMLEA